MTVMEFLVYQSKVAVCLAVLYLFFRVLMGGVRLHALNRVIVLLSMLLSAVLPLVVITVHLDWNAAVPLVSQVHEAAEVPEVHHRELPGILGQIAGYLGYKGEFVAFAEESDEEMLDYLCQVMKSSWEKQMMDGKDKMFSIFDRHLSVIIASPKMVWDSIRKEELLNNAGAVMYSKHAESWHALVLILDEGYELQHAEEIAISPSSFSPSNWKICTNIGELLIQRGR